jgi:hypothetical protein
MPEVDQYSFSYQEILELLVKKAGLHEGKWQLNLSFGFTAGNMGPTPPELVPGAIVAVTGVGLSRAKPDSPEALTIDAAKANPAST